MKDKTNQFEKNIQTQAKKLLELKKEEEKELEASEEIQALQEEAENSENNTNMLAENATKVILLVALCSATYYGYKSFTHNREVC